MCFNYILEILIYSNNTQILQSEKKQLST